MNVLAFSIERDRLAGAVERVAKVIQKRNTIPVLANVLIRAEGSTIELRGTDLDVEAMVRVDGAEVGIPGAVTVPAAEFSASLSKWPDGTVKIEADDRRLTAKVARSRATLPIMPESDFPDIRSGSPAVTFKLPGSDLIAMAAKCGFAASTDETRYTLNGIFLEATETQLTAVATDGHRLSRFEAPLPDDSDGMPGVIIPSRTIRFWPLLLGKDESEPVTVEVSPNFIRFTSELMTLHSKLVDGTYPDYRRVIPHGNNQVAIIGLADLSAAVDRLLVYRDQKDRAFRFNFGEGEISIAIRADTGEAEEIVTAECDFPLEIGFNGKYLREILATLKGPKIRISLNDPGSPTLITDEEDPRRELVIMPMRV